MNKHQVSKERHRRRSRYARDKGTVQREIGTTCQGQLCGVVNLAVLVIRSWKAVSRRRPSHNCALTCTSAGPFRQRILEVSRLAVSVCMWVLRGCWGREGRVFAILVVLQWSGWSIKVSAGSLSRQAIIEGHRGE